MVETKEVFIGPRRDLVGCWFFESQHYIIKEHYKSKTALDFEKKVFEHFGLAPLCYFWKKERGVLVDVFGDKTVNTNKLKKYFKEQNILVKRAI